MVRARIPQAHYVAARDNAAPPSHYKPLTLAA